MCYKLSVHQLIAYNMTACECRCTCSLIQFSSSIDVNLSQSGLTVVSAFNWYRNPTTGVTAEKFNIPKPAGPAEAIPDIPIPTLGIIGETDAYTTKEW